MTCIHQQICLASGTEGSFLSKKTIIPSRSIKRSTPQHCNLVVRIGRRDKLAPNLNSPTVEATRRVKDGIAYLFVMNHNDTTAKIELDTASYRNIINDKIYTGSVELPAKDVWILGN
jgi:beta-galactosidase GanA